jgi:hypothetical protein
VKKCRRCLKTLWYAPHNLLSYKDTWRASHQVAWNGVLNYFIRLK